MRASLCAADGARATVKMATVIWRPNDPADGTAAWKQWFCPEHYGPLHAMLKLCEGTPRECMRCGQAGVSDEAFHFLLAYVFPPGQQRRDGYLMVCDDCLSDAIAETRAHSQLLPDRPLAGPTTERPPTPDPWAIYQ